MEQNANITEVVGVPVKWTLINKKDYETYGIASTEDAKAVISWQTSNYKEKQGVVTLYNYGSEPSFIDDLADSFVEIDGSVELQKEYGIYPVYCEKVVRDGKKIYLCALKVPNATPVSVDVYFEYEGENYALHTVIDSLRGKNFEEVVSSSVRLGNIMDIVYGL